MEGKDLKGSEKEVDDGTLSVAEEGIGRKGKKTKELYEKKQNK